MNYRVKGRVYWGGDCIFFVDLGVYQIGDATRMKGYIKDGDAWLEPTEEPVYRVWCRDYRLGAYVYPVIHSPTGIGRATEEVALLRQTQRDGDVGSDYWLVREEDEG
jgi:hypothetical protein